MATYTVLATEFGAYEKTLVASTVDTVSFTRDIGSVEVLNESTTVGIYFTTSGTAPTIGGGAGFYVPPASFRIVPSGDDDIKIISSGAAKYSVSEVM